MASSFTIDLLAPALSVECHKSGIWPYIYVDGYGQYRPHILDGNSPLYDFHPDLVFLAVELTSLVTTADTGKSADQRVQHATQEILRLVDAFKMHSNALLVLFDFANMDPFPFAVSGGRSDAFYGAVNQSVASALAGEPQIHILSSEVPFQ